MNQLRVVIHDNGTNWKNNLENISIDRIWYIARNAFYLIFYQGGRISGKNIGQGDHEISKLK